MRLLFFYNMDRTFYARHERNISLKEATIYHFQRNEHLFFVVY